MKKITFLFFAMLALQVNAQNSQKPAPLSWTISNINKVEPIRLEKPNLKTLRDEDAINDKNKSIPWRFGYDHYVNYGISNAGYWQNLPNGDRIWRISFISPEALSMNLIFDEYQIPVGGKVFIYNNDRSEILNEFTHEHNNPEAVLGTWMVKGEHIWIEYFEPKKTKGQAKLNIANVIHGYRSLDTQTAKALNDSGDCNVDVNCDISATSTLGNDIKNDVKKSVAMLVVGGSGFCTGALVNNTNNDETPYFLTANHCLGGSVAGWAFRFNWASDEAVADCATTAPSINNGFIQTASGAILRASNSKSDMALVEITDTAFFNANPDVVWAGWNRSTTATPTLNVGVHHPSGDIQKVCLDFQGATRTTTSFNGNATAQMWRIADWDLGVTEPGSSGSPLFDQNGHIIGKLSGGSAACTGTNDNGGFDIYGRFGVSWDFSAASSQQLKFWLDPANTDQVTLDQFPPLQVFNIDAAITVSNIPSTLCDNTIMPTIRITNEGNNQLTSATIAYQLDSNTQQTINWTGSLALGEFEDIPLAPIAVSGIGSHNFNASISNPNGTTDQSATNNSNVTTFTIPQDFETDIIKVIITPDRYGGETTWELTDSNGSVVGSGGPYTTIGTNTTQPDEITDVSITNFNECYTFTINDSYGDGICCLYGAGSYRLENGTGTVLINGNGSFGSTTSDLFKIVDALSINENLLSQNLQIYPNPSSTNFTVRLSELNTVSFKVTNVLGQNITSGKLNLGDNTIQMQNEASGLYFISITDLQTNESIVKKIIKN